MLPNLKKYVDFSRRLYHLAPPLLAAIGNVNFHTLLLKNSRVQPAKDFCASLQDKKLKRFELDFSLGDQQDVQACEAFFKSQSETLERMTLQVAHYSEEDEDVPNFRIKLPLMKTLNYMNLDIQHTKGGSCIEPIKSKNIPCLRKLNLPNLFTIEDFLVNDEFSSVQELIVGWSYPESTLEQLRRIGPTFPNLRKLKIQIWDFRDDGFPVIFSLSQLEDLYLEINDKQLEKNINYTLSGLPVESAWLITQLAATKLPLISSLERTQDSLQTMKCLKRLTLKFESRPVYADDEDDVGEPNPFVIDEVGVHFGFLSMPRLQQLNLLGDFTISDDGADELKKFHYSVVINPNP